MSELKIYTSRSSSNFERCRTFADKDLFNNSSFLGHSLVAFIPLLQIQPMRMEVLHPK